MRSLAEEEEVRKSIIEIFSPTELSANLVAEKSELCIFEFLRNCARETPGVKPTRGREKSVSTEKSAKGFRGLYTYLVKADWLKLTP